MIVPNVGLNAVAGRPKEEYGVDPTAFDEMRPGCYDVDERIKDMNAAGVLASMNFPSLPGLLRSALRRRSRQGPRARRRSRATTTGTSTSGAARTPDASSRWRCRCCGTSTLAVAEVKRVAAKGCHSITFTENPAALGYPSYHDEYWDPFWTACVDHDIVISVHLGSSGQLVVTAPNAPVDVMITLQPMNICRRPPTSSGRA